MNLSEYLTKNEIPVSTAARELGYSRQRIYQVKSGQSQPGAELIRRIMDWSHRQIDFKTLLYSHLNNLESQIKPEFDQPLSRRIDKTTLIIEV